MTMYATDCAIVEPGAKPSSVVYMRQGGSPATDQSWIPGFPQLCTERCPSARLTDRCDVRNAVREAALLSSATLYLNNARDCSIFR